MDINNQEKILFTSSEIKKVPNNSGVYIYYDEENIIYVGKAKNLKKRMNSYLSINNKNTKTIHLIKNIKYFKFQITNTEQEALLLENKLIKKYNPKYNILLKDDKSYPYIILTKEKNPYILKSRSQEIKGHYYGPFTSASFVNEIIKFMQNHTSIRKCNPIPNKKCIYYDMNLCYAPCLGNYEKKDIEYVKNLLNNDFVGLKKILKKEIEKASENLEFEIANKYNILLKQIDENRIKQIIELKDKGNFLAIHYYKNEGWLSIAICFFENGVLSNINCSLHNYYEDYYEEIVKYIYLNYELKNCLIIDDNLKKLLKDIIYFDEININKKQFEQIKDFLLNNAKEYYFNNVEKINKKYFEQRTTGFDELNKLSNKYLKIIEMFDISHTNGSNIVASKIVYENGKKNKKLYRKYNLKDINPGDDYEAMGQVIKRSLKKMEYMPDLIIIDGGHQHVKTILPIIKNINKDIKVIGLVKNDKHQTKAIINEQLKEYNLKKNKKLYKFLYEIQEEVHRFAIDFHHLKQSKAMVNSFLDQIEGIGKIRKQKLYNKFGTLDNILNASEEELKEIIPLTVINKLKYYKEKKE